MRRRDVILAGGSPIIEPGRGSRAGNSTMRLKVRARGPTGLVEEHCAEVNRRSAPRHGDAVAYDGGPGDGNGEERETSGSAGRGGLREGDPGKTGSDPSGMLRGGADVHGRRCGGAKPSGNFRCLLFGVVVKTAFRFGARGRFRPLADVPGKLSR